VGDVAARLQLSRRRLVELFKAEVGMTPKLFARVRRFERARALARRAGRADWGAIALASGYSDQPHLIRDFLAFSGRARPPRRGPGQGRARRGTHSGW
jgi:transcriptional regulator GlxA family with amidase domain